MRTPLLACAAFALVLSTSACGDGDDAGPNNAGPAPVILNAADIDYDAWKAALVAAGSRENPDMVGLERLTRDHCDMSADEMRKGFTYPDTHPEMIRINLTYVCPSRAGRVDEALAANASMMSDFDAMCALPVGELTEEQSLTIEAAGGC